MRLQFLGILAGTLASTGCASIIHGTRQDVGISSSPTNAAVKVDGLIVGNTPVNAKLTRKDNHIVSIELAGYQPYETTFTRGVSGWVWGNIAFGGLIGLAIDAIDGGMYKLTPEQLHADIRAQSVSVTQGGNTLFVAVVLKPDPSWQKVGQLVSRIQ
jgi:hypothetical protein